MMRNIILIIALLSLASCNFKAKGNHGGIKLTHDEAVETVQKEENKVTEAVIVEEKAEDVNVQAVNEAEQPQAEAAEGHKHEVEKPALEESEKE